MKQYTPKNVSLTYDPFNGTSPQGSVDVVAEQDDQVISREFAISSSGSRNILVGVRCTDVTSTNAITLTLQSSLAGSSGEADWLDGNTATVTADGWFYIRMNVEDADDQAKLPLGDVGRVTVTTGADDLVTVHEVLVLQ